MKPYYYRDQWTVYVLVLAVVVTLVVLHFSGILKPVESGVRFIFEPITRVTYSLKSSTINLFSNVFTDKGARILELESEVAQLKADLIHSNNIEEENIALRRQLGVQAPRVAEQILVHVIGERPASSFSKRVLIDAGTDDGVALGDPVLYDSALVGYVVSVERSVSDVMLITDPNSTIPAYTTGGATGLLKGDIGFARITLTQIDREATVSIGDSIITAGTDGKGEGIVIGEVSEILTKDRDTYQTVTVEPLANLRNLDILFIYKE